MPGHYIHVRKFGDEWAFVPSRSPDPPATATYGAQIDPRTGQPATLNYPTREAAIAAGLEWWAKFGVDNPEVLDARA